MNYRWLALVVLILAAAALLLHADPEAATHGPIADLAPPAEPGKRLVILGQIFDPSGLRPVAGVTIHAYQTDANGVYNSSPAAPPRLRGWVTTDRNGRFELRTIRPGSYPGGRNPAHIHLQALEGPYPRQWLGEIRFADDPLLSPRDHAESQKQGKFAPIVATRNSPDGVLHATINIRLSETGN